MLLLMSLRSQLHPTDLHSDAALQYTRSHAELRKLHSPQRRAEAIIMYLNSVAPHGAQCLCKKISPAKRALHTPCKHHL